MSEPRATETAYRCRACARRQWALARPGRCGLCGTVNSYSEDQSLAPRARRRTALAAVPSPASTSDGLGPAPVRREEPSREDLDDGSASHTTPPPVPVVAGERRWVRGSAVEVEAVERVPSGWAPWASVTGECVRRQWWVFGGARGSGKTRCTLQVLLGMVRTHPRGDVVYGYAEGRRQQIILTALEVGWSPAELDRLVTVDTGELRDVLDAAEDVRPLAFVADALRAFRMDGERCDGASQAERSAVAAITAACVDLACPAIVMQHMDAETGTRFAGGGIVPQLSHGCFQIDRAHLAPAHVSAPMGSVVLRCSDKNRNGPTDVHAVLHFNAAGKLVEAQEVRRAS